MQALAHTPNGRRRLICRVVLRKHYKINRLQQNAEKKRQRREQENEEEVEKSPVTAYSSFSQLADSFVKSVWRRQTIEEPSTGPHIERVRARDAIERSLGSFSKITKQNVKTRSD